MSELKGFLYTEKSLCGTFDYILEKLIKEEGKGVYKRITFRTPDATQEISPFRKIDDIIKNSDRNCIEVDLTPEEYLSLWFSKCGDWITPFLIKYKNFCRPTYVIVHVSSRILDDRIHNVLNYIEEHKDYEN